MVSSHLPGEVPLQSAQWTKPIRLSALISAHLASFSGRLTGQCWRCMRCRGIDEFELCGSLKRLIGQQSPADSPSLTVAVNVGVLGRSRTVLRASNSPPCCDSSQDLMSQCSRLPNKPLLPVRVAASCAGSEPTKPATQLRSFHLQHPIFRGLLVSSQHPVRSSPYDEG